jgi:hypothetical protein
MEGMTEANWLLYVKKKVESNGRGPEMLPYAAV